MIFHVISILHTKCKQDIHHTLQDDHNTIKMAPGNTFLQILLTSGVWPALYAK